MYRKRLTKNCTDPPPPPENFYDRLVHGGYIVYKEGARRVTEMSVKMCTDRRRSNRQETTNAVDSKHCACL